MAVAQEKTTATTPKSPHVSDSALAPFLQSQFDAADYLNATLPSLSLGSKPKTANAVSLADLSSQTQHVLSQLNAHTTRLSAILTQLTNDILRSGGRLAYEVEVLRGEAIGLTESLTDGLKSDVDKFLPGGINLKADSAEAPTASLRPGAPDATSEAPPAPPAEALDTTPEYLSDLRTLTTVRSRLESVIKVFGEAMHWTLPPSEVSRGASLISVSAPEPGTDSASREQKGKEFAASLRSEIADLVTGDPEGGMHKAKVRIQALRDLAQLWKGTAEEKARTKFIDGLVKLAEDKQRELEREKERNKGQQKLAVRNTSASKPQQPQQQQQQQPRTNGFLENLQRIRGFVEQ